MRSLWKVFIYFFMASAFYFPFLYADSTITKTEKIKIVSACCINNKWQFRIYDGVSGKTISLTLGVRNIQGWIIKSFNEVTRVAQIETPSGFYKIAMQEASLQPEDKKFVQSREEKRSSNSVSRKQILDKIK